MTRRESLHGSGSSPVNEAFARDVLHGLGADRKHVPCRWLYDARGSALFEEITRLPEYYPTRTEMKILAQHAPGIAAATPDGVVLVEFGSGSSRKTEILLRALREPSAYVPIDVSRSALADAAERLGRAMPALRILPVEGDFLARVDLPPDLATRPRLGFFPGSTIGNLGRPQAKSLLGGMRERLGAGARLIIGVDLVKDPSLLVAAYDDARGVTADFNLNLLTRINRELGGDFDLAAFAHEALWNADESRMELYLASLRAQRVRVLGRSFHFAAGERIHTEYSHKYTPAGFASLASGAAWRAARVWMDEERLFSVHELVSES